MIWLSLVSTSERHIYYIDFSADILAKFVYSVFT